MKVIVNIQLKEGVLDPQGKAVHHALSSLKFNEVQEVRIGKQIILDINETDKNSAQKMVPVKAKLVSNKNSVRKHLVVRGDTLTDIALKYGVSARSIKAANNMKTDNVLLGQTLKIPAQPSTN